MNDKIWRKKHENIWECQNWSLQFSSRTPPRLAGSKEYLPRIFGAQTFECGPSQLKAVPHLKNTIFAARFVFDVRGDRWVPHSFREADAFWVHANNWMLAPIPKFESAPVPPWKRQSTGRGREIKMQWFLLFPSFLLSFLLVFVFC